MGCAYSRALHDPAAAMAVVEKIANTVVGLATMPESADSEHKALAEEMKQAGSFASLMNAAKKIYSDKSKKWLKFGLHNALADTTCTQGGQTAMVDVLRNAYSKCRTFGIEHADVAKELRKRVQVAQQKGRKLFIQPSIVDGTPDDEDAAAIGNSRPGTGTVQSRVRFTAG